MDSGNRHLKRIGSTGIALTAAAALVLPGTAAAAEKNAVVAGQCADQAGGTKQEDARDPDDARVRTTDANDSADGEEETDEPASLSLTGTLDLRAFDALTGLLCDARKGAVDALTRPGSQNGETSNPDPGDTPGSDFDENDSDNTTSPESGTDTEPSSTNLNALSDRTPTSDSATSTAPGTGADGGGWGVSTGRTPGALDTPPTSSSDGSLFSATPHEPRAAKDSEPAAATDRLPLLLAVLSLVLVSAALAHTWARRALLR